MVGSAGGERLKAGQAVGARGHMKAESDPTRGEGDEARAGKKVLKAGQVVGAKEVGRSSGYLVLRSAVQEEGGREEKSHKEGDDGSACAGNSCPKAGGPAETARLGPARSPSNRHKQMRGMEDEQVSTQRNDEGARNGECSGPKEAIVGAVHGRSSDRDQSERPWKAPRLGDGEGAHAEDKVTDMSESANAAVEGREGSTTNAEPSERRAGRVPRLSRHKGDSRARGEAAVAHRGKAEKTDQREEQDLPCGSSTQVPTDERGAAIPRKKKDAGGCTGNKHLKASQYGDALGRNGTGTDPTRGDGDKARAGMEVLKAGQVVGARGVGREGTMTDAEPSERRAGRVPRPSRHKGDSRARGEAAVAHRGKAEKTDQREEQDLPCGSSTQVPSVEREAAVSRMKDTEPANRRNQQAPGMSRHKGDSEARGGVAGVRRSQAVKTVDAVSSDGRGRARVGD